MSYFYHLKDYDSIKGLMFIKVMKLPNLETNFIILTDYHQAVYD